MKYRVAKEILTKDFEDKLLCICGGLFPFSRVVRCERALCKAIKALDKMDKIEQILKKRDDGNFEGGRYIDGNHWQILDEIEEVMNV